MSQRKAASDAVVQFREAALWPKGNWHPGAHARLFTLLPVD